MTSSVASACADTSESVIGLGVLGSLTVSFGGKCGTPSAPKLRNVLAMLMVHADQVVPVSVLTTELWGDEPPSSAQTTLQTYILNLRKMFVGATGISSDEVSREVLVTRTGGYMLKSDCSELDTHDYDRYVAAGWAALDARDDVLGVWNLTEALRIWRGPALADVPLGRVLESKRHALEESRLVVTEHLVGAKLRARMYREVLTELAALTTEHPLHEGLQAQYMRALHLVGRRAQALEVFHRLRRNLIDELGLEPEPHVQRVHQAILNSDTDLDADPRVSHAQPTTDRASTLRIVR